MTQLYQGVDASTPGAPLPDGTSILCGYVGSKAGPGAPDTPHVWTAAEWNTYIDAVPELRLLPIYVHDYPGDPVADADNCAESMLALGWTPHIGRLVAIDAETLIDGRYFMAMDTRLSERGFSAMLYGSAHFVTQNPPLHGWWVASLMPRAPRALPPNYLGQQWKFGASWDYDVFTGYVYENCGIGARHEG